MINGYDIEWYRIWKNLNKDELKKWSATGPNDLIMRSPLEKSLSLRTAGVQTILLLKENIQAFVASIIKNDILVIILTITIKITITTATNKPTPTTEEKLIIVQFYKKQRLKILQQH